MPTGNGNGSKYWIRWLIGILWTVFFFIMVAMVNNVIANDKESRERDAELDEHCEQRNQIIYGEIKEQRVWMQNMDKTLVRVVTLLEEDDDGT